MVRKTYTLWEMRTNNVICEFDSEHEALLFLKGQIDELRERTVEYLQVLEENLDTEELRSVGAGMELTDLVRAATS